MSKRIIIIAMSFLCLPHVAFSMQKTRLTMQKKDRPSVPVVPYSLLITPSNEKLFNLAAKLFANSLTMSTRVIVKPKKTSLEFSPYTPATRDFIQELYALSPELFNKEGCLLTIAVKESRYLRVLRFFLSLRLQPPRRDCSREP